MDQLEDYTSLPYDYLCTLPMFVIIIFRRTDWLISKRGIAISFWESEIVLHLSILKNIIVWVLFVNGLMYQT